MFDNFKGALSSRKWNEFLAALESRLQMRGGKGVLAKYGPNGFVVSASGKGGTSSAPPACALGQIYNPNDGFSSKAVRGGAVAIGDKNLNIPYYDLDGVGNGQWLLEVSISGVSFNTDDDDSLMLPGIETATGSPTWNAIVYTGAQDYTDTTNPTTPTGTGTAILPIGLLTVTSGQAYFSPTGCGSFLVTQCGGVMTYARSSD